MQLLFKGGGLLAAASDPVHSAGLGSRDQDVVLKH